MPNWVYNNLSIEGTEEAIAKVKAQLNKPIVKQYGEDKENTTGITSTTISGERSGMSQFQMMKSGARQK